MCDLCDMSTEDLELASAELTIAHATGEKYRRPLTYDEQMFGDVEDVREDIATGELLVIERATPVVRKMANQLADEALALGSDVTGIAKLSPSYMGELSAAMLKAYRLVFAAGTAQVERQYERQTGKLLTDSPHPWLSKLKELAEAPNKTPDEFDDVMKANADIAASAIAAAVALSMQEEAKRNIQAGIVTKEAYDASSDVAARAGFKRLEVSAVKDARQSMGMGRISAQVELKDDILEIVYTAVLDTNMCSVCASMDGQRYPADEMGKAPNNDCLGFDYCRCFEITIFQR